MKTKKAVKRHRVQINLTINPEIHAAAVEAAYANGETLSRMTERLYLEWIRGAAERPTLQASMRAVIEQIRKQQESSSHQ